MKPLLAAIALTLALAGCSGNQSGDSNTDNLTENVPVPGSSATP